MQQFRVVERGWNVLSPIRRGITPPLHVRHVETVLHRRQRPLEPVQVRVAVVELRRAEIRVVARRPGELLRMNEARGRQTVAGVVPSQLRPGCVEKLSVPAGLHNFEVFLVEVVGRAGQLRNHAGEVDVGEEDAAGLFGFFGKTEGFLDDRHWEFGWEGGELVGDLVGEVAFGFPEVGESGDVGLGFGLAFRRVVFGEDGTVVPGGFPEQPFGGLFESVAVEDGSVRGRVRAGVAALGR